MPFCVNGLEFRVDAPSQSKGSSMTGSMNWTRVKSRAQKRQQGTEDKKAERSSFNPSFKKRTPGPKLTKDEQRAQAEKALAEWKARQGSK